MSAQQTSDKTPVWVIPFAARCENDVLTCNQEIINDTPAKNGDYHLVHVYSPKNAKLQRTTDDTIQILQWMELTFKGSESIPSDEMEKNIRNMWSTNSSDHMAENMQLAYKIYNSDQKDNFVKMLKNLTK